MKRVIWKPQAKQRAMLARGEDEGFYGGAAGGGKSDYLVIEALRQVNKPRYRGLILRKTVNELKQLLERAQEYYGAAFPTVSFNATTHTFTFPSGAKIEYSSLFRPQDKFKYQGLQYEFIGFDELTQFTQEEYNYLKSRNRANGPGMKVYMRATGNPGGIGHGWVKDYFVKAGEPEKTVWNTTKIITPDGEAIEFRSSRVFVPSSVFDNRILLENDPDYVKRLAELPEAERNALLYGDWNTFEGQVFREFRDDPIHYGDGKFTHVIDGFKIPQGWQIIRSFDMGFTKPFSVGWHAVDFDGRYYRINEYYGCVKGRPNTGVEMNADQIARNIRQIELSDVNLKGRKIYGIADPAIFAENGSGSSIAAMMAREGVYFQPADNQRLAGKMQFHYRLAFSVSGYPMYQVFRETCPDFIRTIPNLVYSQRNVEDIDTECEDHIYDEARYAMMVNSITPRPNVLEVKSSFNPLDFDTRLFKKYLRY